jgi:hypothetical protein
VARDCHVPAGVLGDAAAPGSLYQPLAALAVTVKVKRHNGDPDYQLIL